MSHVMHSLDKNEKVDIVTVPTMHATSQCHCNCAGKEQELGTSTEPQLPSHQNDPVSTCTLELDPCSPNPQPRICAHSGFSQWYLLNALRFAGLCAFSFYSVD